MFNNPRHTSHMSSRSSATGSQVYCPTRIRSMIGAWRPGLCTAELGQLQWYYSGTENLAPIASGRARPMPSLHLTGRIHQLQHRGRGRAWPNPQTKSSLHIYRSLTYGRSRTPRITQPLPGCGSHRQRACHKGNASRPWPGPSLPESTTPLETKLGIPKTSALASLPSF